MELFIHFFLIFINLLEFLLILRCLLSWLVNMHTSRLAQFVYFITDPLVEPFRMLLDHFDFLRSVPIDFSPLCAYMLLQVMQSALR